MMYLGDFAYQATVDFMWSSNAADGASITRATNGTISVYKGNSTTQTTTGVTDTEDFDAVTGVHHCRIVTTDAFYAVGNNYMVVLSGATIDGKTVNAVLAQFSIENRRALADVVRWNGTAVATPHTAGYPVVTVKDGTGTGEIDTASGKVLLQDGALTATVVATGAIDADALAADAGTEIGTAVWATASRTLSAATNVTSTGAAVPITAGGLVSADVTAISTDATAANNAEAFFDGTGYAGTNNVIPTVTTVTTVTTVNGLAANAITAAALAADAGAEIADAVWDEATAGHTGAGTTGKALVDAATAGDPWATALPGAYGAGTAGNILGNNLNATVASRSTLDAAGVRTAVGLASANLDTQLADVPTVAEMNARTKATADYFDPATDAVTVGTNNDKAGYALSAAGIQAIWDALTSALTTVGSIGKRLVDNLDAAITSRMATFSYTAPPTAAAVADAVWDEATSGHATAGTTGKALTDAQSAGDPWATALPGAYGAGTAGNIVGNTTPPPTAAAVADAVWDEATAGHATAGTTGKALTDAQSAGDPWATALPGSYTSGQAGKILGDNLNATVASRSTLDAAGVRTAVGLASANLDTQLADVPTVAEMNARTKATADYFDPATDAVTLAAATHTGAVIPTVTAVTNDVGITQTGADKVWATASRTLSAFGFSVTVGTNNDKTGYALSAAGVQAIWDALTSALTTVGSIGKRLVDNLDAAITSRLATAGYTAPPTAATVADAIWDEARSGHTGAGSFGEGVVVNSMAANTLNAAALAADAGTEIGTAVWATASRTLTAATNVTSTGAAVPITAGGLVSADVTAISTDTTAANNAEAFFDGTGYAGTNNVIPTVTTVNDLGATARSRVNAEVLDVLTVDTFAEPSGVPAATSTIKDKLNWVFMLARNKRTTTAALDRVRNDADTSNVGSASISDDGTTFTRGEYS